MRQIAGRETAHHGNEYTYTIQYDVESLQTAPRAYQVRQHLGELPETCLVLRRSLGFIGVVIISSSCCQSHAKLSQAACWPGP